jgi:hypothetical protein
MTNMANGRQRARNWLMWRAIEVPISTWRILTMKAVSVISPQGAGSRHRSMATNCAAPANTVALISAASSGDSPLPAARVPNSSPIGSAAATNGAISTMPARNSVHAEEVMSLWRGGGGDANSG